MVYLYTLSSEVVLCQFCGWWSWDSFIEVCEHQCKDRGKDRIKTGFKTSPCLWMVSGDCFCLFSDVLFEFFSWPQNRSLLDGQIPASWVKACLNTKIKSKLPRVLGKYSCLSLLDIRALIHMLWLLMKIICMNPEWKQVLLHGLAFTRSLPW